MTLNEAIEHAKEKAKTLTGDCADQHHQLALWLEELVELRQIMKTHGYQKQPPSPNSIFFPKCP